MNTNLIICIDIEYVLGNFFSVNRFHQFYNARVWINGEGLVTCHSVSHLSVDTCTTMAKQSSACIKSQCCKTLLLHKVSTFCHTIFPSKLHEVSPSSPLFYVLSPYLGRGPLRWFWAAGCWRWPTPADQTSPGGPQTLGRCHWHLTARCRCLHHRTGHPHPQHWPPHGGGTGSPCPALP